jgi:hypothetical protein
MLILHTDHGYFLGERGYVAKKYMPVYDEIARLPFFIWDPRSGVSGERRNALAQTIDIPVTLLDYFGAEPGRFMQGKNLRGIVENGGSVRDAALFGYFGMHTNITDGRYVYMRASARPGNKPLYQYTLMPAHHKASFSCEELRQTEDRLCRDFAFTKGTPVLKIPVDETIDRSGTYSFSTHIRYGNLLFDTQNDPGQERPLADPAVEARLIRRMKELMTENEAPEEQFRRLGLEGPD